MIRPHFLAVHEVWGVNRAGLPWVRMPQPGDPCPGFISEPGRCWQMVYDHNLQARRPLVAGVGPPDHLDGLTGLREFGRSRAVQPTDL